MEAFLAKWGLKIIGAVVFIVVILVFWSTLMSWGGNVLHFFGLGQKATIEKQAVEIVQGKADTAQAQGEALTAQDVLAIVQAGASRDRETVVIHERNADRIQQAPGARAPLDPGLVDAINRGLCKYPETPDCSGDDQLQ